MFWEKCGKLIADDAGKLIDCDNCPCPYWGLFVFVIRSYDRKTDQVNYCYQSVDVELLPVTNNCIQYSYYDVQRNIKVNRTPDNKNQVGMVKNCVGCYTDCVEWDQNGQNCIREQEYCQDCSQIRVYRISPCFDTKKEAFEYFYSPCGVQPDADGNYPEDQWSDEYYNCLDYWLKQANKYKVNATFTFEDKEWSRSFYGTFVQDCDYVVRCYDWETGQLVYEGADYPADGEDWDCMEYQTNCRDYVISSSEGQFWGFIPDDADYTEEQLEAVVGSAIADLNNFIESQIADQSKYQIALDKRENSLCFSKNYESVYGYYDYAGWGNCCSSHKWYGVKKTKLKLQPFDENRHPKGAKGVIVDYTLKRTLTNSYEDSVVTEQKFQNIFIPFDGDINFPLADNLSRFYQCQCYSSFTGFQASNYKLQRYDINFVVKDYKF